MEGEPASPDQQPLLYCIYHPGRTTLLRCSKCERPICTDCAIATPVGYRCRECAQLKPSPIYQVSLPQYLLASLAALAVSSVGIFGLSLFPHFLVSIVLGVVMGGLVAQAMDLATGHRRGRGLQIVAGLAIGLTSAALVLLYPPSLIASLLYAASAISTAAARLA